MEIWWEGVDWIQLAQERDQWRAVMNTGLNFGFHKWWGISSPA